MKQAGTRGVVLMGLVVLLALAGLSIAQFSESVAAARQREREADLLWIGQQYRRALESYYAASPGVARHLPVSLEELLRDSRFPMPVRHLRRLYADPLQPEAPWGLVKFGNQIVGVYSQSEGTPLRRAHFGPGLESFEGAGRYSDWRFMYVPRANSGPAAPAPGRAAGPIASPAATTP